MVSHHYYNLWTTIDFRQLKSRSIFEVQQELSTVMKNSHHVEWQIFKIRRYKAVAIGKLLSQTKRTVNYI